jgi:trans-2,3-dihydro-3-hydroxyanthranilate isomerase
LQLRYRIVDVFSDSALAGNALCVVLDETPPDVMQAIAREVNLSETTFPTRSENGTYDVRIFTPYDELPFAGHPTIGTAWVLGPGTWTQRSSGATVTVEADERGAVMGAPEPTYTEVDTEVARRAAKLKSIEGAWLAQAGVGHIVVPTTEAIGDITPDLAAVADICQANGAAGFAVARALTNDRIHARVFCPSAGISEDPGTGSAAGPIALLCRERFGLASDLTIQQGDEIRRPCRISVHAESGALRVGGAVTQVATGQFSLRA